MSFLKREHAPLTEEAWQAIDEAARMALETSLTARRLVDVSEPRGFRFSALSLGRLDLAEDTPEPGVAFGLRRVLPLVETRVPFEVDIWELDNLSRGAEDVDLTSVEEAAARAAAFEDRAVLLGLPGTMEPGMSAAAGHPPVDFEHEANGFLEAVSGALLTFRRTSIGGPYALVTGRDTYLFLASAAAGYPLMKRVRDLIQGPILESHLVEGALLTSLRGGDFALTLGQDFAVGYETHDTRKVRLYLTESFAFQLVEPKAVMRFERS